MIYSIIITAENKPGVLNRITGLFSRRKINIEYLSAQTTHKPEISQIIIKINSNPNTIETLTKQINNIIEIIKINYHVG